MASSSWISHFPKSVVHSLEASESDHFPIFLDTRTMRRRRRVFTLRMLGCMMGNVRVLYSLVGLVLWVISSPSGFRTMV